MLEELFITVEVLFFLALFGMGTLKHHLKNDLLELSRKEKMIFGGIIVISVIAEFYYLAGKSDGVVLTNDFLSKVFFDNFLIVSIMEWLFFRMPALIVFSILLKGIAQKGNCGIIPVYYFGIVTMSELCIYQVDKWNIQDSIMVLGISILLFCLMDCFRQLFTRKKIIYICFTTVMLIAICLQTKTIPVIALQLTLKWVVVGIFLSVVLKYIRYLRVTLRRTLTLLIMFLIVILNFKSWY